MTDSKTATERLRELLDERGVKYTKRDGMKATSITSITHWYADGVDAEFTEQIKGCTRLTASGLTPEQAIAATLGKPNRIYILRGTDPGVMPSCGGETNELLGVFATREAAEEAMSANGRMYCELNVTEWEVDE